MQVIGMALMMLGILSLEHGDEVGKGTKVPGWIGITSAVAGVLALGAP